MSNLAHKFETNWGGASSSSAGGFFQNTTTDIKIDPNFYQNNQGTSGGAAGVSIGGTLAGGPSDWWYQTTNQIHIGNGSNYAVIDGTEMLKDQINELRLELEKIKKSKKAETNNEISDLRERVREFQLK